MDRGYLTHPKVVGLNWESILFYPVLWMLSVDGELEDDYLNPMYLSAITNTPVGVVADSLEGLRRREILVVSREGMATLIPLFSSRVHTTRALAPVPARTGKAPEGGLKAPALAREPARTREGLEPYLEKTWGELITRGKPLSDWVAAQVEAHPTLDLLAEAKKARAWEVTQKKPKKALRRFLGNWFNRAEGYKEETKIRAEGGEKHWSGMNTRERQAAIKENRNEFSVTIEGVSLTRDLRDDMFVLSGQDLLAPNLKFRAAIAEVVRDKLNGHGDPYDPDPIRVALKDAGARAENDRALTWAVDRVVVDMKHELGMLPV